MKRFATLLVTLLLATTPLLPQEKKETADDYNTVREFKNKVFDIRNRDPRDVAASVRLLGSGFKGSALSVNSELRTITVRDYPENIAAIEDAIARLDKPAASEPDIEMKISVLIGSKNPLKSEWVPEDLSPVVKQLQSTLRYTNYGLMTATAHRTKAGHGLDGSGVAEPTLLGMSAQEGRPIFYSYQLKNITLGGSSDKPSIDIGNFNFSMRIPINVGPAGIQYQNVGFETPVSIRPNEKVVIGTTTMGEKALIVVVNATVK